MIHSSRPVIVVKATPNIKLDTIVTSYDSNISAAIPAQSPTLSPTKSAITAGLRGSSSSIPASTLPTKSAPTSAALVNIPPPTRIKRATNVPPNPKPNNASGAATPKIMKMIVPPKSPKPSVSMPVIVPAR